MRVIGKRVIAGLAIFTVLTGLGGSFVSAQGNATGNGFRISPVRSDLVIEKGKSQTITITVENPTGGKVTARAVVNNFIASDQENGEPRLILEDKAQQPKNNFKQLVGSMPDVVLEPNQKKEVPVTISIPENGTSGGYYGAIRFLPIDTEGDGNVALTASVGTIVLIRVPGDLEEKLSLTAIGASQKGAIKSFFTGGGIDVSVRLKNIGNIHVQPFGKVQVKDMFGKVVKEYELNATEPRANILPESIRRFDTSVEKPKRGWFGRYSITANIGYSQGSGDLISSKTTFWYLPTWFLIAVFLVLVSIIGAIFWFRGRSGGRKGKGPIRRF